MAINSGLRKLSIQNRLGQSKVALGVGLLFFWIVVGTVGFVLIEGWSIFDAFYMTVITVSTVGFGEVHPLSSPGRLFASLVIVSGLSTAVYTFTSLGQLVIEGELAQALGRRKMRSELEELTGHYIVCGFGRVGRPVVEGLQARGLPFCVVVNDPTAEEELRARSLLYVIGDATDEDQLMAAGVQRAKAVLALLPSDAENLYLTLTAKGLNPEIVVTARASNDKAEAKLKRGGADHVVSPYRIAGGRLLQIAVSPTLFEFMELVSSRQHLRLGFEEVKVCQDSIVRDRSIAEAEIRKRYGVIVVAIKRENGEMVFNPDPGERMKAGDILVALGKEPDLAKLERACRP